MVKPDASRDYYADLEVPPTASEEEIKRAFRNLGLYAHLLIDDFPLAD
jgi:curved DNA-binding protein CbpA